MSRPWRIGAILLGGLIAFSALANLVEHLTPTPHGPGSSSYATAPDGLAAYAELLGEYGHPVRRVRSLGEASLDPASTAILLDPDPDSLDERDVEALRSFLRGGGRLMAGGTYPDSWLERLLGYSPAWAREAAGPARPVVPVPEVVGVETVESAGPGSWSDTGRALPVVAGEDGSLIAVTNVGAGRAILVADPSPLQNRLLDHADNAALGLALAGEKSRTVRFIESVHGYRPATGFGAIPWSWRFALGGLALAALTLMLARGRRLGPPEAEGRELPPPRRVYVESLAAVLARTKKPDEAIASVREEAKRRLTRRAELTSEADSEALGRSGRQAGLTEEELAAVLGGLKGKAGVLAAGRALAKLETTEGSAL